MNKISPVNFEAAKFAKTPQIKPRINKNASAIIDEISTFAKMKEKTKTELDEHLISEIAASPVMGFNNFPIIKGILGAIKGVK